MPASWEFGSVTFMQSGAAAGLGAAAVVTAPLEVPTLLFGMYRSRMVRYAVGATGLAFGAGAAWLVVALRDRLDYYQRSQRELAAGSTSSDGS